MKKLVCLFLALVMCLSLAACGGDKKETTTAPAPSESGTKQDSETATDQYGTYTKLADSDEKVTLRIADASGHGTIHEDMARLFGDILKERSGGKIDYNYYGDAQLGDTAALSQSIVAGDIDISYLGAGMFPQCGVMDLPGLFADEEKAKSMYDNPEFLNALDACLNNSGITLLWAVPNTYRNLTSNKLVKTADDVKGLKIRLPGNTTWLTFWGNMGAVPQSIEMGELYLSLQQGMVEAEENSTEMLVNYNLMEVQHYYIRTNHVLNNGLYLMNKAKLDSLPADMQQLIRDTAACMLKWFYENWDSYSSADLARLKEAMEKNGCEEIIPDQSLLDAMVAASATMVPAIRKLSPESDNLCNVIEKLMGIELD